MSGAQITLSLSRPELLDWATNSVAFHNIDLSRISTVLLAQVYSQEINRVFNVFDLTQPIKVLENLSTLDVTGDESQFNHSPLTGLYKKHFMSARFLVKNLAIFTRGKEGRRHFIKTWDEAARTSGSGTIDETFTNYLTHHIVFDPIQIKSNSRRMTGEWVVFHKYQGNNYYLTLASHDEANDEIYKRVKLACEFDDLPFSL